MPPSPPSSTAREEGFALVAAGPLAGRVRVPGDKSISHRALMLAALAEGESRIEGLLEGEDVFATANALHAMGAGFAQDKDGAWRVRGVGARGLRQPVEPLEMGNSGTSTRLLMGLLASRPINASFVGDASLSARPMARVMEPLARIGARFEAAEGGRLPISMRGARPAAPIEYRLPVASAQVKSAVLLAGLNIAGTTRVIEPAPTRDHSERMLAAFGAELTITKADGGRMIAISGPATLLAQDVIVPGDPSSAAFLAVAALIVPGSEITIENVGINPTRAGLFELLEGMGADLRLTAHRTVGGEPVADLVVRASRLHGIDVPPEIAPSMIDEFPILFVAAALAGGRTVTSGLEELRVKESDRLRAMADGLRAIGARVEERADGLVIEGAGGAPLPGGATIAARLDHRVAMSFAIAGLASRRPVRIDDMAPVATSFPGFVDLMTGLGARALTPRG